MYYFTERMHVILFLKINPGLKGYLALSLSTLVLNSRDRPENIWLPKRMHLDKQPYKNQNTKNQP